MIHFTYRYQMALIIFLSKTIFGQVCQSGSLRVSPDKSGERLNGSVYITFQNYGPNSCFDECIRRPRCHSFNYNMDSFYCEINEKPSPEVFVSESGYEYVYISPYRQTSRDPCSSDCAEGEICITLYNGLCTCLVDDDDSFRSEATTQMTTESETTAAATTGVDTTTTAATTEVKTTQSGATTESTTNPTIDSNATAVSRSKSNTTDSPTTEATLSSIKSKTTEGLETVSASTAVQATTEHQTTTEQQATTVQQSSADVTSTEQTTNNRMTEKSSTDNVSTMTLESTTA